MSFSKQYLFRTSLPGIEKPKHESSEIFRFRVTSLGQSPVAVFRLPALTRAAEIELDLFPASGLSTFNVVHGTAMKITKPLPGMTRLDTFTSSQFTPL